MGRRGVAVAAGFAIGIAAGASGASAQVTIREGVRLRPGGTVHVQYEASSLGTPTDGRSFMELRRLRPRLDFEIGDWISGRIEPDFAQGRARIRYGYADFAVTDGLGVRAGSFKRPFGAIQLTSSSVIPVIERGVRIAGLGGALETRLGESGAYLPDGRVIPGEQQALLDAFGHQGYALGVSLHGEVGALSWEAGVFDGPTGGAAEGGRRGGAAARGEFDAGFVRVGAGGSWSQLELDGVIREGPAVGLDIGAGEPARPGSGLLAELVYGASLAGDDHGEFAGVQAIVWTHRAMSGRVTGFEPVMRASWGDPDQSLDSDSGWLLTPGFNLYIGDGNRLMFNWDVWVSEAESFGTEAAFRAQAQVAF